MRVLDRRPEPNAAWSGDSPDPGTSAAPYRLYNIGNHQPVELLELVALVEAELGEKATLHMLPMQPGDVVTTEADTRLLEAVIGTMQHTPVAVGVARFVDWYRQSYQNRGI